METLTMNMDIHCKRCRYSFIQNKNASLPPSLFLCQAKSKGFHYKYDLGVKYAEKQQRRFAPEKLREGRNIIGLQVRAAPALNQ